jgi:hypothetical protein
MVLSLKIHEMSENDRSRQPFLAIYIPKIQDFKVFAPCTFRSPHKVYVKP